MANKLFLDANVIIDFILKRPEGYQPAKAIFEDIVNGQFQAYTSPVAIHIVTHIAGKILGVPAARKLILSLLNEVQVLDTSHDVMIQALGGNWHDVEDAFQYYTALRHRMDIFISRDEGLHKKALPPLPVLSPDRFVKLYG